MMTVQEKIASLPHINTIKDKVKDVMWFRTDNPNIVIKVTVNWEKIDVRDREAEKQRLQQEKQIAIDDAEARAIAEVQLVQMRIDDINKEYESWQ